MNNYAPMVRIVIRYLAGAVAGASPVLSGLLNTTADDSEAVILIASLVVMAVNEGWYMVAKKRGGAL